MDPTEALAGKTAISYIQSLFSRNSSKRSLHNNEEPVVPSVFSHKEIKKATNNFKKQIGEGGYGTVYLGQLRDKRMVAVKTIPDRSIRVVKQFNNEVDILSRVRHNNLIAFYGSTVPSAKPHEPLVLVYEFVPNGTVKHHLHSNGISLKWPLRIKIATETAGVLCYLHSMGIIHRDVKPDNILLDNNFQVKLADLGLCRLWSTDNEDVLTVTPGTAGYQDPEYDKIFKVTDKTDVYSFGVVLIELISRKQAVDVNRAVAYDDENYVYLDQIARKKMMDMEQLVDQEIGYDSDNDVRRIIDLVAELALKCLQPTGGNRPTMDEVYRDLKEISSEMEHHTNFREIIKEMRVAGQGKRQEDNTNISSSITMKVNISGTHIYAYKKLKKATNNFKEEIGRSGYGLVYLGILQDKRKVAVKVLSRGPKTIEHFSTEVSIVSRHRHQNIIALYGCTDPHENKLVLVYEFVPNGSLNDHLYSNHYGQSLPWVLRLQIATETADALAYLHSAEPPVIHRDLNTSIILLDDDFHVKVTGFLLSRLTPSDNSEVFTKTPGTMGYRDPEYTNLFRVSDKSDVYSFGVVLMELISGRQSVDVRRDIDDIYMDRMALKMIKNNRVEELVDPKLGYDTDSNVRRMIDGVVELSLRCLQPLGTDRPPMVDVLRALRGIKDGV